MRFLDEGFGLSRRQHRNLDVHFDGNAETAAFALGRVQTVFVADSLLEEAGFEPSVPLRWCGGSRQLRSTLAASFRENTHIFCERDRHFESCALHWGVRLFTKFKGCRRAPALLRLLRADRSGSD